MKELKKYFEIEERQKKQLFNFAFQITQLLAFFSIAFVVFYFSDWSGDVFAERDISRAEGWLEGNFYWPGPEMSGGNNLPGPFFYFLLLPAFLMGEGTYSQVFLWAVIWLALTYSVAFFFISKIISHKESLLVFLFTFIITYKSFYCLNPNFSTMFHVLSLISLYYWREKRNDNYLYLTGFIVSLGVQVHLLVALHILTVLFCYLIDKKKNLKALGLFLLFAFSSFLVYGILKFFHVFEITGNHYISNHTIQTLTQIFSERWFQNIKKVIIPFILFFSVILILIGQKKYKLNKRLKPSTKNLLFMMAIPFLMALLIARYNWYLNFIPVFSVILISKCLDDLMPKKINERILLLVGVGLVSINLYLVKWILFMDKAFTLYLFILSFFLILIISLQWNKKQFIKNILLGFCIFALAQISALYVFPYKKKPPQLSFSMAWPEYRELYPLMRHIYLETGRQPQTAMKKIFYIGIDIEKSLLIDYTRTVEQLNNPLPLILPQKKQETHLKQNDGQKILNFYPVPNNKMDELNNSKTGDSLLENKAQAYFIIQHLQRFVGWIQKDWRNYLSQSSLLPPILSQEIKEGKILIQKPKLYKPFWLIPYQTTENSLFPEGFHNTGQPYYWEEPKWLKNCGQTQTFKNNEGLFYCKASKGYLQRAGLNIQFSKSLSKKTYFYPSLTFNFFGPSLGTRSRSLNLDGALLWSNIKIYLKCGKKSLYWNLPNIGYQKYTEQPEEQARMLLAPLKLQIPLKECKKEDIRKVTFTFTEKHTYRDEIKESVVWKWD